VLFSCSFFSAGSPACDERDGAASNACTHGRRAPHRCIIKYKWTACLRNEQIKTCHRRETDVSALRSLVAPYKKIQILALKPAFYSFPCINIFYAHIDFRKRERRPSSFGPCFISVWVRACLFFRGNVTRHVSDAPAVVTRRSVRLLWALLLQFLIRLKPGLIGQ
jgi:hypothetical protein